MYGEAAVQELSRGQFDAARLGFFQLLRRKRMSPQFVDRHAEDLFAQACFEYSRRVSEGIEIGDPAAWIVTCCWNRTRNLLESRDYKPQLVSTESVAEPVAPEPGPEEAFLEDDRGRKIREAVGQLPLYQRRLLALSYFEGQSIREAARRLHWTASKAQRAHEAAQKRVLAILGVESTDELQVEVGLFCFLSVCAERASAHVLPAGAEAMVDHAHRGISALAHRTGAAVHRSCEIAAHPSRLLGRGAVQADGAGGGRGPLGRAENLGRRLLVGGPGEAGAAIAGEGGSRALEVCKGLAVCVIGGGALTGALVGGGDHGSRLVAHDSRQAAQTTKAEPRHRHPRETAPAAIVTAPETHGSPSPSTQEAEARPAPRHPKATHAPHVEEAVATAVTGPASEESQEAVAEEQFQNFAATEESGGGAGGGTGSVTQSATSAEPASTTSKKQRSEEAGAAKQFHSLLE